jgi:hypothetical protein
MISSPDCPVIDGFRRVELGVDESEVVLAQCSRLLYFQACRVNYAFLSASTGSYLYGALHEFPALRSTQAATSQCAGTYTIGHP